MLKGEFFTLNNFSSALPNQISAEIEIHKGHPIFEGHFPQKSVVPGVCWVQIVKELFQESKKSELKISKGDNFKFLAVVDPSVTSLLKIEIDFKELGMQQYKLNAKAYWENIVYFKCNCIIELC